jgi:D-sedoheptulose 7-phosphate isomerase
MEIRKYFEVVKGLIDVIPFDDVEKMTDAVYKAYEDDKMIFIIGNGGSAAKASHVAQDFSKGLILDQSISKRVKALSLTDNIPYITALANDTGYENVFSAQLRTFASQGDYLLAISGSGNSPNIIAAAEFAKDNNMTVIGVTGYGGGRLKELSDISVNVQINDMCMAESFHSLIFHYVVSSLRKRITGEEFEINDQL